nr:gamma-glutamyl-gamma-aminobutyrate hydrolase family protein [Streptomyces sp. SID3343]
MIGVSAYTVLARWGVWEMPATVLPTTYTDAVVAAGGVPVVLPADAAHADVYLDRIDALVLAGGGDVDPAGYGAEPHPRTGGVNPLRDASELMLLRGALERRLPVLGICRGLQLLNVARGGTLHQHLPEVVGSDVHASAPATWSTHGVRARPDTHVARLHGRLDLDVVTYHHQGIDRLGRGLTATAHAPDGTIEAVEDHAFPFLVAVQWHPEMRDDPSLLRGLVRVAAKAGAGVGT